MKASIFIICALGIHFLVAPCWAKAVGNSRGGAQTQQKGESPGSDAADSNRLPRYPLDKLPSLQQAVKFVSANATERRDSEEQEVKVFSAIPFSIENTEEQGVVYNYNFLGIDGDGTELLYADDKMLITCKRASGDNAQMFYAVHMWRAQDYSYMGSLLIYDTEALNVDTHSITVDSATGSFVLDFPSNTGNTGVAGGLVAYAPRTGEFEIARYGYAPSESEDLEEWNPFKNFEQPIFSKFKVQDKEQDHDIIHLNDSNQLRKIPQFRELVHHFDSKGEDTIRRLDFNSLRLKKAERIPKASEINISDIHGLPELPAGEEYAGYALEDVNNRYLVISYKRFIDKYQNVWEFLRSPFVDEEETILKTPILVYDTYSKSLMKHLGEEFSELGLFRQVPYYSPTEMGHWIINCYETYHSILGDWWGPRLQDPESGKNSPIAFPVDNPHNDSERRDIGYRVLDKLPGWESLGVSLCEWAMLPGDSTKSYWLAGGNNICALILMDETTKTGRVIQSWRGAWGRSQSNPHVRNPVWVADKRWLCLPAQENCWDVYEIKDFTKKSEKKCSIYTGSGDAWALVLPDGRYAGSPGCEKLLCKQTADGRIPMELLAPWYNRPAEVLEAIGGNEDDIVALRETTKRWLAKLNFDPESMPPVPENKDFATLRTKAPKLMTEQLGGELDVEVSASARKAVTAVEVRVNGVLIPQECNKELLVPAGKTMPVTLKFPYRYGQNNIEFRAVDSMGGRNHSFKTRVVRTGYRHIRRFIVSLGVSDYDDDSLDLQYAAQDARDIVKAFTEHGNVETKVLTLTDKDVSDISVLDKVRAFLSECTVDDQVVFYLAGHGMLDDKLDYYYAPSSFDAERIADTGISMDALVKCVQSSPALQKLMLIDTCHSGILGEEGEDRLAAVGVHLPRGVRAVQNRGMKVRKTPQALATAGQQKRYIEDIFSLGDQYRGVNIVAGAAGAEFALESEEWNNGVFTAAVMQTLAEFSRADDNNDGLLTVAELLPAIQSKVQHFTGGKQMPTGVIDENNSMVIATSLKNELINSNWDAIGKRLDKTANAEEAMSIFNQILEHDKYSISSNVFQILLNKGVAPEILLPHIGDNSAKLDMLLKAGLSPEGMGEEALIFSYLYSPESLKLLLAAGANPNALDKEGKTAVQRIVDSYSDLGANSMECLLLLLQHGASTYGIGKHCKRYDDFCLVKKLHQELKEIYPVGVPLPEGNAPDSLEARVLCISYNGATSTVISGKNKGKKARYPDDGDIKDELIGPVVKEPLKTVRYYRRTGANTAVVKNICVNVENEAFLWLIARYADKLTVEQIAKCTGDKSPFIARNIKLTFDTPTRAKGEYVWKSSWEEIHYENLSITLEAPGYSLPTEE